MSFSNIFIYKMISIPLMGFRVFLVEHVLINNLDKRISIPLMGFRVFLVIILGMAFSDEEYFNSLDGI